MDEYFVRLFAGTGAIEWIVIFSFVAYAVIYFLAPVLGYQSERRGLLLVSLYLLLVYAGLILLQLLIQYVIVLASSNNGSSSRGAMHLATIFAIFKLVVFLASQGAFVFGLQGLRRGSAAGQ